MSPQTTALFIPGKIYFGVGVTLPMHVNSESLESEDVTLLAPWTIACHPSMEFCLDKAEVACHAFLPRGPLRQTKQIQYQAGKLSGGPDKCPHLCSGPSSRRLNSGQLLNARYLLSHNIVSAKKSLKKKKEKERKDNEIMGN